MDLNKVTGVEMSEENLIRKRVMNSFRQRGKYVLREVKVPLGGDRVDIVAVGKKHL